MKNKLTIKELAVALEDIINEKMNHFQYIGQQVKDLNTKIDALQMDMADIVEELKPVEFIVHQQHPNLCELFDSLKELKKDK